MGSLSIWHWLIVLVIVVLVFGTKRLKNVGKDLGEAVKGFKQGIHDEDRPGDKPAARLPDETRDAASRDPANPGIGGEDRTRDDERTPR